MRHVLTILLVLHGAIHLFGFAKWTGLAAVPQLSGRTLTALSANGARAFGIAWLAAALALVASAGAYALRDERWWTIAIGGVALSQLLIVVAWPDARFGTIANVIVLACAIVGAAQAQFDARTAAAERALLAAADRGTTTVEAQELERLPAPVRTWLARTGIVGRARARTVRLEQRGAIRTSPDAAFAPADATQRFSIRPPGFVWRVQTRMFGVPITGRDTYAGARGRMLITAAGIAPIVDQAGEAIDQGALLRFLGEMVWFPSAALEPYLAWEPIDGRRAQVTITDGGRTASAIFSFDGQGRVVSMSAERYLGGGADAKLTPWQVTCTEHRVVRGVEIPTRGDVAWKLEAADFSYYRWEILDVEINSDATRSSDDASSAPLPATIASGPR